MLSTMANYYYAYHKKIALNLMKSVIWIRFDLQIEDDLVKSKFILV